MKTILALMLAAMLLPAKAADPFTPAQTAGLVLLGAVSYQDYKQTLDIRHKPGLYETNPLLGHHPSDAKVRNYFVGSSLLTIGALHYMPSDYRKYLLGAGLVMEIRVTRNNTKLGLEGRF